MNNTKNDTLAKMKQLITNPKIWQLAVSAVVIAVIALCFFHPDAISGNSLNQSDMLQGAANGQEAKAYEEATGETTRWTNSLFGGMPTFQISPTYPSNDLFRWITTVYGLGLPSPSNLIFMMMIGFMILMLAMNVRWQIGLIGAIAWGFSTYFIIIIGAGHIWKFVTLSYIPPTIAGVVLCYKGRYLLGGALTALFAMMQVSSNHAQMTYYFCFVILGMVIAYLFEYRKSDFRKWGKATATIAAAGILAVAANIPSLYNTYEYSKETIRGGHSELSSKAGENNTGGLDRNYITQYSYGTSETFSLMIPNVKGGASAKPVGGRMQALTLADLPQTQVLKDNKEIGDMEEQYLQYVSQYFGEPEGTNGPVYVGIAICALFVIACFVVRGPLKWAMLVLTLLSILLALGRNCQWLTDLFIDYVPMYNKFRTVESILVIAEFTMPFLAIIGLQQMLEHKDWWNKYKTLIITVFGVFGAVCFLGMVFPGMFGSVITAQDEHTSRMIVDQLIFSGYPQDVARSFSLDNPHIYSAVVSLRENMISSDCLRSLGFLLATLIPLVLFGMRKMSAMVSISVVGILLLADLYTVNKRYVNHDSFTGEKAAEASFALDAVDRAILADTAMNYRVMDVSNFWGAARSYHHKMLGGYHAAKLTRYQDIIDEHLSNLTLGVMEYDSIDMAVVSMLNAKYITDGKIVEINPDAMGNAWLVDGVTFVDGADAEMDALSYIDLRTHAVADSKFRDVLDADPVKLEGDTIYEISYAPNRLAYHVETARGGVAVFSEVYFPWGWKAEIDGEPVQIGRVNYILRAMNVPAGSHTVVMTFDPDSIHVTTTIATIAIIVIYLLLIAAIVSKVISSGKRDEDKLAEKSV